MAGRPDVCPVLSYARGRGGGRVDSFVFPLRHAFTSRAFFAYYTGVRYPSDECGCSSFQWRIASSTQPRVSRNVPGSRIQK